MATNGYPLQWSLDPRSLSSGEEEEIVGADPQTRRGARVGPEVRPLRRVVATSALRISSCTCSM